MTYEDYEREEIRRRLTAEGRYCVRHRSIDSDADGICGVKATLSAAMRHLLSPCEFTGRLRPTGGGNANVEG